jgi:hypothetical protein
LVSEVRILSRRHGLFGQVLPVIGVKSARGPNYVMVRLPDGRSRSIPRSITDLAVEPSARVTDSSENALRISVRTLLPLGHFLTARSSSLEEIGDARAVSGDAGFPDISCPERIGVTPTPAAGLEEAFVERQNADRVRRGRDGEKDGGDGGQEAR